MKTLFKARNLKKMKYFVHGYKFLKTKDIFHGSNFFNGKPVFENER